MGDREPFDLLMERPLSMPIAAVEIPQGYSIISINEENGCLWEKIMDQAFGNYEPGDFRYVIVSNNYYQEDRVFVLLDENEQPVATASSWQYDQMWNDMDHGTLIFAGSAPSHRGRGLGYQMVNYVLHDLKRRGFKIASLDVEENNIPAIKTYIRCGFLPQIEIPEHIEVWNDQFVKASIAAPEYDKSLRPRCENPHPPRPWPYGLQCAATAAMKGDVYLHGVWERHNLYLIDEAEYAKIKLLPNIPEADKLLDIVKKNPTACIFANGPLNPSAVMLETGEGNFYISGKNDIKQFADGIIAYISSEIMFKYKDTHQHPMIFSSGDNWKSCINELGDMLTDERTE